MSKYTLRLGLLSLVLILLQVVLFNHLLLFQYFLPILYLYPLIKMPYRTEPWVLTLLAACIGLFIDLMMNTPGLNMASSALALYLRPKLLGALVAKDDLDNADEENPLITPRLMGAGAYLLFILTLTLVQISSIFLLEFFSTGLLVHTLPYIGGSVVITVLLFMIFDTLLMPRRRG